MYILGTYRNQYGINISRKVYCHKRLFSYDKKRRTEAKMFLKDSLPAFKPLHYQENHRMIFDGLFYKPVLL